MAQFARLTVLGLRSPNGLIEPVNDAVSVTPLLLLLQVLARLAEITADPCLTDTEFLRVLVPLSRELPPHGIADAVIAYRNGHLDVSRWPSATPRANDRRTAREFPLFLVHHGFIEECSPAASGEWGWSIGPAGLELLDSLDGATEDVPEGIVPDAVDFVSRERRQTTILARPEQRGFRRAVVHACGGACVLSGESIPEVLEASHIVPVEHNGTDASSNGLLLRADLHRLFDAGLIRIGEDGLVQYAAQLQGSQAYSGLRTTVPVRDHAMREALSWRREFMFPLEEPRV
ncbi:MAG: HNH endonuclease [Thermomicrobiales bacterium]